MARCWILLLLLPTSAHAWHVLPPGADAWGASGRRGVRGITVGPIESIQQPDRGYGTATSAALLDHLVAMGAEWISITPFGRLWSLSSTEILMDFEAPYPETKAIAERCGCELRFVAHGDGLQVELIAGLQEDVIEKTSRLSDPPHQPSDR